MSDFVGSPPQEWDFSPNLFVGRVVGDGVIILSLRIIFELSFALDSQTMSFVLQVPQSLEEREVEARLQLFFAR